MDAIVSEPVRRSDISTLVSVITTSNRCYGTSCRYGPMFSHFYFRRRSLDLYWLSALPVYDPFPSDVDGVATCVRRPNSVYISSVGGGPPRRRLGAQLSIRERRPTS